MKYILKKVLICTLLLVLCIVTNTVYVPICEATSTVLGDTTLLAPPYGVESYLSYNVETNGSKADTTLSIGADALSGVTAQNDKLVIVGANVKNGGEFVLNSAAGTNTSSSKMTLSPIRYFEDFEGETVGAKVWDTTIKNLDGSLSSSMITTDSSGVIAKDSLKSSNHYASGAKGEKVAIVDLGTAACGAKNVTVKMKIQNPKKSDAPFAITMKNSNGEDILKFGARDTWNCLANYYGEDGKYGAAVPGCELSANQWYDVLVNLDFSAPKTISDTICYGKYTISVDGKTYYEDYAMISGSLTPDEYLKTISIGFPVDDIAIFSGQEFDGEDVEIFSDITVGSSTVILGEPPVTDFTLYNTIVIRAKNNKKFYTPLIIWFQSENPDNYVYDYWYTYIDGLWTGEKEFVFEKGSKGFHTGSLPLGWDKITSMRIGPWPGSAVLSEQGKLTNDNPEIFIESIILTNRSWNTLYCQTSEDYIPEALPPEEGFIDYASQVRKTKMGHPRLFMDEEYLDNITAQSDAYLSSTISLLKKETDSAITKEPNGTYNVSLLATASAVYNITKDEKLVEWIWKSVLLLQGSWIDRGTYLTVGDNARYLSYVYDFMYNHWTEEQRTVCRNILMHNGLEFILRELRPYVQYAQSYNNLSTVMMSAVGTVALAFLGDDPSYDAILNECLNRAMVSLRHVVPNVTYPSGEYREGFAYWNYGIGLTFLPFLANMQNVLGNTELLTNYEGVANTGLFPIGLTGSNGCYNYGDSQLFNYVECGAFFFLSQYFDNPIFGAYQKKYAPNGGDFFTLMMYRPDHRYDNYEKYMSTISYFPDVNQVMTIRQNTDGTQDTFLGIKAGQNFSGSHLQLDIGSYIFDSMGVRWACELGLGNYNIETLHELGRFGGYRNRAEGQNTLVINPNGGMDQNTDVDCRILEYEKTEASAYAVMDISKAYSTMGTSSVKRGFALLNKYRSVLIQDEIISTNPADVYSFMHTQADIEIAPDGKSAVLTQDGKKMRARLLSPASGTLLDMPADPLPGSPDVSGRADNSAYRKLTVYVKDTSPTIALLLTPYEENENAEFCPDSLIPLNKFSDYTKASELSGDTLLLAPPKSENSYVTYSVLSDNTTDDFAISIDNSAPKGIIAQTDKLVLLGNAIENSGEFALNVSGGVVSESGKVSLSPVCYFEDFEDETIGAKVWNTTLKNLDGTNSSSMITNDSVGIITKDSLKDSNHYALGAKGEDVALIDLGTAACGAKNVTVKMKVQNPEKSDLTSAITMSDSNGKDILKLGTTSSQNCLANYYDADANYKGAITGCTLNANQWYDVEINLDFTASKTTSQSERYGKYTISVDGNVCYKDYAMISDEISLDSYLKTISIGFPVDDIAIFSGKSCNQAFTLSGSDTLLAPPPGEIAETKYEVIGIDAKAVSDVTFSVSDAPDGVDISENGILLHGSAVRECEFTLTAKDSKGVELDNKKITISPVCYFEDFENETVGAKVYDTTIKKLDGSFSSMITTDSLGIITDDSLNSSNHYALGTKGTKITLIDLGTAARGAKNVSIKMKIQNSQKSDAPYAITMLNSKGKDILKFGSRDTWNCLANYYGEDGKYGSAVPGCELSLNQWYDVLVNLDFSAPKIISGTTYYGKYTIYVDKKPYYEDYAMISSSPSPDEYLKTISIGFPVDDIAIFSGYQTETLYTVTGPDTMFIPFADRYCKYYYSVKNEYGAEETDVVFSVAGQENGFKDYGDAIVISGNDANEGEYALIAKNKAGKILTTKKVDISNIQYSEDFNDILTLPTSSGMVSQKSMISDLSEAKICVENGNYYAAATTDEPLIVDLGNMANGGKKVTLKGKYFWDKTDKTFMQAHDADGNLLMSINTSSANECFYTHWGKDGIYSRSPYYCKKMSCCDWLEIEVTFDFENNTYSLKAADVLHINQFKMINIPQNNLKTIQFNVFVDDITVSAGEDFSINAGAKTMEIPLFGTNEQTIVATYSDTNAIENLKITTDAKGFSISGNTVISDASADVIPAQIVLSDGFVKSKLTIHTYKDYLLLDGKTATSETSLGTGTKTIKACFGKSNSDFTPHVVIAHYDENNRLADIKFGTTTDEKTYTAEMTKNIKAGETIKIFKWSKDDLTPFRDMIELK